MKTTFDIRPTDTTLRDGSDTMSDHFTEEHVRPEVRELDNSHFEATSSNDLGALLSLDPPMRGFFWR